jgi:hypothetical protein
LLQEARAPKTVTCRQRSLTAWKNDCRRWLKSLSNCLTLTPMTIYELRDDSIREIKKTTFAEKGIFEKFDLQRLLRDTISVVASDAMVIAEEFGNWEDSKRRIDLLCLDREANLIVVELKRTEDGGHMDLQAIRYAAMISAMTFDSTVSAHTEFLRTRGRTEDARQEILDFLDWEEPEYENFAQNVKIVLVSGEFSKELTTSVLWLNERELDIRCVRLRPYELDSKTLLDVQQVIPLPEAAEYIVRQKGKKAEEGIGKRTFDFDLSRYDLKVGNEVVPDLTARGFLFQAVKAAIDGGATPEKLASLLSWGFRRWLKLPGSLSEAEFREKAAEVRTPAGLPYKLSRYYSKEDQLFRVGGNTYALSNQWSHARVEEAADRIAVGFPELKLSYEKKEKSPN